MQEGDKLVLREDPVPLTSQQAKVRTYCGKRLLDVLIAAAALFFLSPLMVVVALSILVIQGRPILYVQQRPGCHGRPFRMLKFRSMTNERDAFGNLLQEEERITRLGRFLRTSSIDELPELINVLRGEMSIVGPRPLLIEYLPLYSQEQMRRHDVKPGITGWAQVNGRNNLTWEDKFDLDCWYVNNISFWIDLKILLRTALTVLCMENINRDGFGHEGTEPFRGSP